MDVISYFYTPRVNPWTPQGFLLTFRYVNKKGYVKGYGAEKYFVAMQQSVVARRGKGSKNYAYYSLLAWTLEHLKVSCEPFDVPQKRIYPKVYPFLWRRERDLNPCIHSCITRFRIVRVRPLRHLCKQLLYYTAFLVKKQLFLCRFQGISIKAVCKLLNRFYVN